MSRNEILGLAVRIAAIFLTFSAINKALVTIPVWSRVGEASMVAIMLLPFALAVVMWKFAFSFSEYLLPPKTENAELPKWGLNEIQEAAYTIIGVYVVSDNIPECIYLLSAVIHNASFNVDVGMVDLSISTRCILTEVKLIIGFCLIFGAKGLVDFIRKVKQVKDNNYHLARHRG
jgi:hypothetical protein